MAKIIKGGGEAPPRAPALGARPAAAVVAGDKKVVSKEIFGARGRADEIIAQATAAAEERRQRGQEDAQRAFEKARDAQGRTSQRQALVEILGAYHRRGMALSGARDQCVRVVSTMIEKITGSAPAAPRSAMMPLVDEALRERRGRHRAVIRLPADELDALRGVEALAERLEDAPEIALEEGDPALVVAAGEMPLDVRLAAQGLCATFDLEVPADLQDPEDGGEDSPAEEGLDGNAAPEDESAPEQEALDGEQDDGGEEAFGQDGDGEAPMEDDRPATDEPTGVLDEADEQPDPDESVDDQPAQHVVNATDFDDDVGDQTAAANGDPDFGADSFATASEKSSIRSAAGRVMALPARREGTRVESTGSRRPPSRVIPLGPPAEERSGSMRAPPPRPVQRAPAEERSGAMRAPPPAARSTDFDDGGGATVSVSRDSLVEAARRLPGASKAAIPDGTRVDVRHDPTRPPPGEASGMRKPPR